MIPRTTATDAADKEANSLATLERDADRLIAAGVNQIICHGFPYVYLDRAEPGWYPFVDPASFSDHFTDHNTKDLANGDELLLKHMGDEQQTTTDCDDVFGCRHAIVREPKRFHQAMANLVTSKCTSVSAKDT